jgi:hypothetical protein
MIPDQIPFQEFGIESDTGEKILKEAVRLMIERPNKAIQIQEVSERTGFPGSLVKEVFYLLLAFRVFKATFVPRHRNCDRPIGAQETSVERIRLKADAGEYRICMVCGETIEGSKDIEIQIVFWKQGAVID